MRFDSKIDITLVHVFCLELELEIQPSLVYLSMKTRKQGETPSLVKNTPLSTFKATLLVILEISTAGGRTISIYLVCPIESALGPLPEMEFYSYLSFKLQIKNVVQCCFHQIRTISKIKPILSHLDLEKVIPSFFFLS